MDGKIPPVTANNADQIRILISKFKRSKEIRANDSPERIHERIYTLDKLSPVKFPSMDGEVLSSEQVFVMPVKRTIETEKGEKSQRCQKVHPAHPTAEDQNRGTRRRKRKGKGEEKDLVVMTVQVRTVCRLKNLLSQNKKSSSASFPPQFPSVNSLQFRVTCFCCFAFSKSWHNSDPELLRGLSFISAWGGRQNCRGGYVIFESYLGGLSHIEKHFEGGCLKLYIGFPTSFY